MSPALAAPSSPSAAAAAAAVQQTHVSTS